MTNQKLKFYTICFLLIVGAFRVNAQQFSDMTFLVADLTDSWSSLNRVNYELRSARKGLAIKLFYNNTDSNLILAPTNKNISFEEFAERLNPIIKNNPDRIYPIFIDYTGPKKILKDAFTKSGLSEHLFFLPPGERWPNAKEMVEQKKNLVVFTFQRNREGSSYFLYTWDYIAEFPYSGNEDPIFDGFYPNGNITNELLMIRDLDIPYSNNKRQSFVRDLNQNQFYLQHLLNRWEYSGKQPNFIFLKNNTTLFLQLLPWLGSYQKIRGIVEVGDKPMEKVFWKHSNKSVTNGFFSFPFSEGKELNLTPYSPGFRFDPQTYIISNENFLNSIVFNADHIPLDEGLTGYFPFDFQWTNMANTSLEVEPVNTSFAADVNRGEVGKFPEESYVSIGYPNEYGIHNHSFTVSVWIKMNEVDPNMEYSILGTVGDGSYRKGLHLVIREGRPYFGFWGNDLWADKVITPLEWHHIVFRYNYFNGEQAIFIDGESMGASLNHDSFLGETILQIGSSLGNSRTYLNGYMDDLFIWDRAIADEDIQFLFNSEYEPNLAGTKKFIISPWWLLMLAPIIVILYFLVFRTKKPIKSSSGISEKIIIRENKNAIFLFGDFQIFDKTGKELSDQFTPKIFELFIILIIYSIKKKKGIKTEELTRLLWDGFPPQKAANNRSVSFNKLRKIIHPVEGLELNYHQGYWKIIFGDGLFCDYFSAFSIINRMDKPSLNEMKHFYHYVKRGVFLSEVTWDWLDEIRGMVINEVIDCLLTYATSLGKTGDSKTLTSVAERILVTDDLNEPALQIIVKQLIENNNMNSAKYRFNQFANKYNELYGQPYNFTFEEFLNHDFKS